MTTLTDQLNQLKSKVADDFSKTCLEGARRALEDRENPLRLNFFSTAMRILFEHMMDTLAPINSVMRCAWFKPEKEDGKPTRAQRINYAIQGGLLDSFVAERLQINPGPLRKRLLDAVDECSKQVHAREHTVVVIPSEQETLAEATIAAVKALLDVMNSCRAAIVDQIAESLDNVAVDALLTETILEVDELSTHHFIQDLSVDRVVVDTIGPDNIIYKSSGSIEVILQYGSNSDVRNDIGAEIRQTFPFYCDIEVSLSDPWNLEDAELRYGVDVSAWRDAMMPDDENRPPDDDEY